MIDYSDDAICWALEPYLSENRRGRYSEVLSERTTCVTIVLDRIFHEHNISAVIRSADAFGIHTVHLVGGRGLNISHGIALGAEQWVNVIEHQNPETAIDSLQASGYCIAVMQSPNSRSPVTANGISYISIDDLRFGHEPIALVFGNEVEGVSHPFFSASTVRTYIPMYGFVESLNVSVAAAICMHRAASIFRSSNGYPPLFPLAESDRVRTMALWLRRDVRGAEHILARKLQSS